jgi:succinoglycan biosynthesis protein ExoA
MRIEVIVPVRDAAAVLPDCLAAIRGQTLAPAAIHLSVAPSTDATELVIASSTGSDPRFRVHENPAGDRGSGLNVALATLDAETEAVAMVDAQSRLEPDYLERSAAVMKETGAAVVGGAIHPVGDGVVGRAIAAALSSRVGVGDSGFHFDGTGRDVESVYLGVYRRSVLDTVGRYDPSLLRTEDDDMNARIRAAGWRIRLDPSIRSRYLGRQTLRGLFRQYRGYGHSKVALAAKRPGAIRLRHLVPAAFVGAIVGAALISLLAWPPALPLVLLAYLGGLLVAGLLRTELPLASRLAFVAAAATMHLGYGIGTWQAILAGAWRR